MTSEDNLTADELARKKQLEAILSSIREYCGEQIGGQEVMQIVERLLWWMHPPLPAVGVMRRLKQTLAIATDHFVRDRRYHATRLIKFARVNDGTMRLSPEGLARGLRQLDPAIDIEPEWWKERIARPGSAELLLAEALVLHEIDALGQTIDMNNDVKDEIDRIRRNLVKVKD